MHDLELEDEKASIAYDVAQVVDTPSRMVSRASGQRLAHNNSLLKTTTQGQDHAFL